MVDSTNSENKTAVPNFFALRNLKYLPESKPKPVGKSVVRFAFGFIERSR